MRIWCFTLFTLFFFIIFLHIYKILDQDDNFFLISLTILITYTYINTYFFNRVREIVSFELGKEIKEDVFCLVTTKKKF